MNQFKTVSLGIILVVLVGCVSTVERSSTQIDKQQALEAHLQLGLSYLQNGDRDRALRAFVEAQKLDKRSAEAMQGFALLHQLNGETEQADESFKKALRLKAVFSMENIELSYAQFLYDNNRCNDAVKFLNEARTNISYPNRTRALYMLGLCEKKNGNVAKSKAAFEHALKLNGKNSGAAIELADLAFEDRNYAQTKKYLDVYAENARQSSRSLWLGIRIERIFGNKDKEASYALALKNLHPYSKEYLEYKKLLK